ncbi:MAG: 16S rRNA (uracil(1498)-N(3))-methyltransferase [Crocinitomicaceae bacterium]|nr:16S rRNA (uracil(1498)-N(3))-methyltransferase [Crocinitomicaceae bacterium]MBK8925420.1 16S rRNA (uracil(1498)-N(3))-methyltransferase [Crocinitomicaceae bacterium]
MNQPRHRFFCIHPEQGKLDEDEAVHAMKVLRLTTGNHIEIIDGKGNAYHCTITEISKNHVGFTIDKKTSIKTAEYTISIAIAPTKNIDRFEFFIEKTTELGIAQIIPIICQNSERREVKTEKLNKQIIAAVKQSGNLFKPEITEATPIKKLISDSGFSDYQKFIAHCRTDEEKNHLLKQVIPGKKVLILIGPEGDFTTDEIALAQQNGFCPVSLGESRLRTETAGIVACHTILLKNQYSF